MDIDSVSLKHTIELEQQITELLKTLRKAKLHHLPIYESLQALEQQLGQVRRSRFDENNSEYKGY